MKSLTWNLVGQVNEGARQGPVYRLEADYEFGAVYLYAGTAPTGRNLIVDIKKDGVSIFDTLKPSLGIGAIEDYYAAPLNTLTSLAEGSVLTLDVSAVGNGEPGRDVTVQLDLELLAEAI